MARIVALLGITLLFVFGIQIFSDNKADVDLWGNVGFVTALPGSYDFRTENTFSFTDTGHSWINHEWFSQYIFHKVYILAGGAGLLILKICAGLALVLVLYRSMRRDTTSLPLRILLMLVIVSTIGYGAAIRPHLFTYLMCAVFLFLLRHHPSRPYLLIALFAVLGPLWVNLHGAFFIGIILVTLFVVLELIKRLFRAETALSKGTLCGWTIIALILVGASFLNPYGSRLWTFIFDSAATPRPYLSEWAPFNPIADFSSHVDFMALSLIAFLTVLLSKRKKDITWITMLLIAFIAGLVLRRNIPLFAIVCAFVIPSHAEDVAGSTLSRICARIPKTFAALLLVSAIAVSLLFAARFNKTNPCRIEVQQHKFPSDVFSFMEANKINGNALVFFDWAEQCEWRLHPQVSVFMDGRFTDAYSDQTVKDYFNFLYVGPNWTNALDGYATDILVLHRLSSVHDRVSQLQNWTAVYSNSIAGLFLKNDVHSAKIDEMRTEAGVIPVHVQREVYFPE